MEISPETAVGMMLDSKGKIFGVTYTKRTTGEVRDMVARLGVTKHLTGGELKYSPASKKLLTVFDMQKQNYRMVNLTSIHTLRMHGAEFRVTNAQNS